MRASFCPACNGRGRLSLGWLPSHWLRPLCSELFFVVRAYIRELASFGRVSVLRRRAWLRASFCRMRRWLRRARMRVWRRPFLRPLLRHGVRLWPISRWRWYMVPLVRKCGEPCQRVRRLEACLALRQWRWKSPKAIGRVKAFRPSRKFRLIRKNRTIRESRF